MRRIDTKRMLVVLAAVAVAAVAGAAACSGGSKPTNLSLSVRSGPTAAMAPTSAVTVGTIRLAIRRIALEPAGGGDDVRAGPFGISVPGNSPIHQAFDAAVPPGDYRELEVDVNTVPASQAGMDATLQALAGMNASIAVDGTVAGTNGGAFTFTTSMEVDQKRFGPFTVSASGTSNVTLDVDPSGWFLAPDGSSLDPRDSTNRGQILANIRTSIRAFPDDDRKGKDEDECECEDHDMEGGDGGHADGGQCDGGFGDCGHDDLVASVSSADHSEDDGHHEEDCTCTPASQPDGGTTPDGGNPAPDGGSPAPDAGTPM